MVLMSAVRKLSSGPGQMDLVSTEVPEPAPGHVIVEVWGVGVCGTDLHIYDDHYPTTPPVTLGHEISGRVHQVAFDVDSTLVGAPVVCETFFTICGTCRFCRDGRPNLCSSRKSLGSGVDGGMAQFVQVPERCLHRLPNHLNVINSALMEPLAAVCNAVLDPNKIEPGDQVLVTGPGPVGLLAAQVARACGSTVIVAGQSRDRARLDIAEELGFRTSLSDRESLTEAGFEAPDVLLECSGAQAAMVLGLQLVRKGGRIIRIGVAGKEVTIPLDEMCYRELTLSSGFASTPHSWRRALSLAAAGQVLLDPIVTEVAPLSAWRGVFDDTRAAVGGKYVFDPRLEN